MILRAALVWLLGLVTLVPWAVHRLVVHAGRDEYALLVTLILFLSSASGASPGRSSGSSKRARSTARSCAHPTGARFSRRSAATTRATSS